MDPSSVLEQTIQDVSNLQAEFSYILGELQCLDTELLDHRKKYLQKDSQIQKFTKQNGSLQQHPKEQEYDGEIKEEMTTCHNIQREKCSMANTALYVVSKHLANLEGKMSVLEEDGLVAPAEEDVESSTDFSRESSTVGGAGGGNERRRKTGSSSSHELPNIKRRRVVRTSSPGQQISHTPSVPPPVSSTSSSQAPVAPKEEEDTNKNAVNSSRGAPTERNKDVNFDLQDYNEDLLSGYNNNEEEDKTLYCFCQSVSYGEMVACDGPNCKYEWFHYSCVNLKEPPRGQWFCPDCRQEMAKNKLKRKKV